MTTLKRTKVLHLKRGQAPYHDADPSDGKVWKTNATPVYARRIPGKPTIIRLTGGHGWTHSMTDPELAEARKVAKRYGWTLIERRADIVIPPGAKWEHLDGDLDCDAALLDRLDAIGCELGVTVFVRSGRRTIEEQWALYRQNMVSRGVPKPGRPMTAYPDPSAPHVVGRAADCGINGVDIGEWPGARDAMERHGVALVVPGEDWHCEVSTRWAA